MSKRRSGGPGISFFSFQDIITAVVGIFILILMILVLELAQRVESASAAPTEDLKPIVETTQALEQAIAEIEVEINQRTMVITRSEDLNAFNIAEKVSQARKQVAAIQTRIETSQAKQQQLHQQTLIAQAHAKQLADQSAKLAGQRQELEELSEQEKDIRELENVLLGDQSAVYRDLTDEGRYLTLVTLSTNKIEVRDALTRSLEVFNGGNRIDKFESWLGSIPLDRRHLLVMIEPGGEGDFRSVDSAAKSTQAQYGFTVVGTDHAIKLGYELGSPP